MFQIKTKYFVWYIWNNKLKLYLVIENKLSYYPWFSGIIFLIHKFPIKNFYVIRYVYDDKESRKKTHLSEVSLWKLLYTSFQPAAWNALIFTYLCAMFKQLPCSFIMFMSQCIISLQQYVAIIYHFAEIKCYMYFRVVNSTLLLIC